VAIPKRQESRVLPQAVKEALDFRRVRRHPPTGGAEGTEHACQGDEEEIGDPRSRTRRQGRKRGNQRRLATHGGEILSGSASPAMCVAILTSEPSRLGDYVSWSDAFLPNLAVGRRSSANLPDDRPLSVAICVPRLAAPLIAGFRSRVSPAPRTRRDSASCRHERAKATLPAGARVYTESGEAAKNQPEGGQARRRGGPYEPVPSHRPGDRIDHYEVKDLLGAGGWAEVCRAIDTRSGATVVLKCPNSQLFADPAAFPATGARSISHVLSATWGSSAAWTPGIIAPSPTRSWVR